MSDAQSARPYCDLIMQGGITSGVVYPKVITTLSEKYHFHRIGGASAGAIAAGVAAAAEYARVLGKTGDGVCMASVEGLPGEFNAGVLRFFQPVPPFRKLFELGLGAMTLGKAKGGQTRAAMKLVQAQYGAVLPLGWGCLLGVAAAALAIGGWYRFGVSGALNALLLALLVLAALVTWRAVKLGKALASDVAALSNNRFGLCSGLTQEGAGTGPGLTNWLTDLLDRTAGLTEADGPLTFRKLKAASAHGIHLQMMTTNLAMRRPHRLPLETAIFYFEESEFRQLFPDPIVDHMVGCAQARGVSAKIDGARKFWPFPGHYSKERDGPLDAGDDLPVVVAIRMSLSFPILIQAVPLYARDYGVRLEPGQDPDDRPLVECLFTDGGVSSNFPMHFFDSILPVVPTFGVSLDDFDSRRGTKRVTRPVKAGDGLSRGISQVCGLTGFLATILATSKDWQDSLLSELAGYRERIATVALSSTEGGLNLTMDSQTIGLLSGYGEEAGKDLLNFDMDEHRWRRFLTAYDKIDELARSVHEVWTGTSPFGGEPMRDFLIRYASDDERSFAGSSGNSATLVRAMAARMEQLADLGGAWRAAPLKPAPVIPKPRSAMRIRPKE